MGEAGGDFGEDAFFDVDGADDGAESGEIQEEQERADDAGASGEGHRPGFVEVVGEPAGGEAAERGGAHDEMCIRDRDKSHV